MKKTAAGAVLLSALMLALAACSSDSGKAVYVNPNIYPAQYRQQIIVTLRSILSDPTHVRNGLITPPVLAPIGNDQRYVSCVRFTERDFQTKQYGAPDTRVAYFYGGELNQLVKAEGDQCAQANYQPFPEIEKLCLADKCP